jgi:hypothetical protein
MTTPNVVRVQRGYFRAYRAENLSARRSYDRELKKWHYRLGWAEWLIVEMVAYWHAEATNLDQRTLDAILYSRPTSNQWMNYVSAGRSRLSTGSPAKQIPFTG